MLRPRWLNGTTATGASTVFFALMAVTAKATTGTMAWAQVLFLRWLVGLVGCLVLFVALRRRPQLDRWPLLVARGLLGSVAALLYFRAIEGLGAGPATVLNYCSPMFAALFAALFLKERPGPRLGLGLVVATVGAALVATAAHPGRALAVDGVTLGAALSAVLGGGAITVVRAVRSDTDPLTVAAALCLTGLFTAAPFALPGWAPATPPALLGATAVGVLALLAQLLLSLGLGHTTAAKGGAMIQLVPALAWVLAVVVLGEPLLPAAVAGSALCIAGVVLATARA